MDGHADVELTMSIKKCPSSTFVEMLALELAIDHVVKCHTNETGALSVVTTPETQFRASPFQSKKMITKT